MKQFSILDAAKLSKDQSILVQERKGKCGHVKHYQVLKKDSNYLKREEGDYFTLEFTNPVIEQKQKLLEKEFQKIMKLFLKKYHKDKPILVIGLGNSKINSDAFGSLVTNQMIATNHYNDFLTIPKVALYNPEVISKTGISSFKLIQLVVNDLKPDLIILIDALATRDAQSLNRVIEISDTGIIPGSALRTNKEINKKTFQIPIVSIGIPFVLQKDDMLLTSAFVDLEVKELSKLIANGLNQSILF